MADGQTLAIDELFQTLAGDARLDEQFWNTKTVEWIVRLGTTENTYDRVVGSQIGQQRLAACAFSRAGDTLSS